MVVLSVILGLAAGAARAQSSAEDERLLEPKAATGDRPAQSRRDDELDDEELDEQVFYSGFGVSPQARSIRAHRIRSARNFAMVRN